MPVKIANVAQAYSFDRIEEVSLYVVGLWFL